MKPEYVTLLTVTISLLSGWGGAFIAGYFSRKASTDAIDREYKIAVEKRKDAERIELLNLYVSIIKADYEKGIVEHFPNGMMQLNHNDYDEEIRPKIYDKYYLIHENIIKYFNNIENKNAEIDAVGRFDNEDMIDLACNYLKMIEEIKKIVDSNRMTLM